MSRNPCVRQRVFLGLDPSIARQWGMGWVGGSKRDEIERCDRVFLARKNGRTCAHAASLFRALPAPSRATTHERVVFGGDRSGDRKSTRLNSSHVKISYAVFCL